MPATLHTTRRVEFADTDSAGLAHFTAFFRWMEEAEHELLRSRGLSVMDGDAQGPISWPRVSAQCDFTGAVRFEDVLDVQVRVERLGRKSITYAIAFTHHGEAVATGKLTAVCCRLSPEKPLQSIAIPEWFRSRLEQGAGESGPGP